MYANLAVEVATFVRAVDRLGSADANARLVLLAAYKALPAYVDFSEVDKSDFMELFERVRNERRAKKVPDLSVHDRFVSSRPPPPKRQR